MARNSAKFAVLALFLLCVACAAEPIRIDSFSDASAEASWKRMLAQSNDQTKKKLLGALIQLNFVGVNSAYEVASSPEAQNLSILRIKDKVAGLTADQIVELANRTSTVKVEVHGR